MLWWLFAQRAPSSIAEGRMVCRLNQLLRHSKNWSRNRRRPQEGGTKCFVSDKFLRVRYLKIKSAIEQSRVDNIIWILCSISFCFYNRTNVVKYFFCRLFNSNTRKRIGKSECEQTKMDEITWVVPTYFFFRTVFHPFFSPGRILRANFRN